METPWPALSDISNRGTQFVANFTWELYHILGIEVAMSTAYHPQTDGQTERVNQELEEARLARMAESMRTSEIPTLRRDPVTGAYRPG